MAKGEARALVSSLLNISPGTSSPDIELDPGFDVLQIPHAASPLVLSSPHSGAIYPQTFLASARLGLQALRRSEDAHVDVLFAKALDCGAPLLRAHFPRAYLDVNREPYELDPRMFEGRLPAFANIRSLRVAGGLGTIARIVGDAQEIYARRLPVEEALRRIEGLYKPYHHSLQALLQRAHSQFGQAILLDCHSMPASATGHEATGAAGQDRLRADVILGDRFGSSCDPAYVACVEADLRQRGYRVRRNKPYAGGFITEHYGHPTSGHHALQIEVNRALYMDEASLVRHAGFASLQHDLGETIRVLADFALSRQVAYRPAAE